MFEDGSAETDFTVAAAKEPEEKTTSANNKGKKTVKTGDTSNPTAWLILMAASLIVMAGIGVRRYSEKRKR